MNFSWIMGFGDEWMMNFGFWWWRLTVFLQNLTEKIYLANGL